MSRIEIMQRAFLAQFQRDWANAYFQLTQKRDEKADAKYEDTMSALAIEWEFATE